MKWECKRAVNAREDRECGMAEWSMGNIIVNGTNYPEELWGRRKGHSLPHCGFRFSFSHSLSWFRFLSLLCWLYFVVSALKGVFFSLFTLPIVYCCFNAYQQHSTTKRKNKNHKNTISFSKNPISNNKFSAFEGGKKKCLPHFLPSMLQDLSSTPPLSFSLSSHVFPLLVVLMMVQIIFSWRFNIWIEECLLWSPQRSVE